jgi:chromosome segregation protein
MFRLHSEITSHKAEISSLENLQETLQHRRQQIMDEKSGSEDESRDTLDAMSRIRTEKQELDEEFRQGSIDLENQRDRMEDMMKEERVLAKNLEELRISIEQLSARKKTIEEMESNYEGYNYAVKFIMRSGLPGIFGTVAELITVPEGYEVAIETAMGAALQNIVCQDDRSAQNAIVKLKENKAGRLTFLPVSSIKGYSNSYAGKLEHEAGFKGFGVDCIEFDSKYNIDVAGKTGSAEYNGVKEDSHAWFTGFAPAEDPEIAVTIIIEGIGSGGDYAAPIAKRIFDAYFAQ